MDIFLGSLFIVVCILLILVVLLQRGRGGGLSGAFGGGGSSSAFGTRTGDVFTWVTIVLTGLFLLLAVGTVLVYRTEAPKVDLPQFVPAEHAISETINARIYVNTPGATIYYTLDDTDPSEKSTRYDADAGLSVAPKTTIKARAFKQGLRPSDVAKAYYGQATEAARTMPAATAPAAPLRPTATQTAPATGPGMPMTPETMPS